MGTVWRALDERLKRWVALKQIRADVTVRHGRERLWREARAAARLNHPSIVHVYDILEGTDGDWIVMELVDGQTIRRLLDEETLLAPARAIRLCREIAEGLAEAHAQGILHRDLKAANVIVTPSGRAKILDFGLAKAISREDGSEGQDLTITIPGLVLGTCHAMSPEQVLGHALDERSDLFSLGSLLYEMLTGEAPFQAETAALSLVKVVEIKPQPLRRFHPSIPSAVCEVVDWLLQKDPRDRPQSAAEVLAILEAAAGSRPGMAPVRPAPPPELDDPTVAILVHRPVPPRLPPLSNRDVELQILLDRFRLASVGSGQAVLIAGEAGSGKSHLVQALSEQVAAEAPTWLIAHGSTFSQNTPLAPIIALLERAMFGTEGSAEARLSGLERVLDEHGLPRPDYAPLLGALLSLPAEERYPPLVLSLEARRKRTLAAILELLGAFAERRPVVLVIEDLHWIDPSTLELVDLLLGEISALPLLLVATFRPEFTAPWRHQISVTQLSLMRPERTACNEARPAVSATMPRS